MKTHYTWTIDSASDADHTLAKARSEGCEPTPLNSRFEVRGAVGTPITLGDSLEAQHVIVFGPAPVYVTGGVSVQIVDSAVAYALEASFVDAYDSSTVYAYACSEVAACDEASVYVASDDVIVNAYGSCTVCLPAGGVAGSGAQVNVHGTDVRIVRR